MFTGIVRERGRLSSDPRPSAQGGIRLELELSRELAAGLEIGASLAVAGVCLTVVELGAAALAVELSPETVARTRLSRLRRGDEVNLEPALRAGDPLGGHWVQGHVDGQIELVCRRDLADHSRFTFAIPPEFDPWIVEKGSVALDGVSLTVASRAERAFEVALIPHTLEVTTLGAARVGHRCHFEADILAKYVERILAARGAPAGGSR
jgi:riboflavin synthase